MKRGRNQRRRQGVNPNRALDSNGPEVRIRGTANQIYDKYIALARDASSSGDRIKAESYLQHAEHYFRMIRSIQQTQQVQQAQPTQQPQPESEGDQPAIEDGEEANKSRRSNGRDRRAAPSQSTGSETAEKAPAETQDAAVESDSKEEEVAEKKPRRRRAKRTTKRAAPADEDNGDDEVAKTAAE